MPLTCLMISVNLGEKKIMGGFGSGRRQGGKDTTSDMRMLDVRRLQRDGLLTPGRAFGWQWTRNGEEVASIQIRTEIDRVMLRIERFIWFLIAAAVGGIWAFYEPLTGKDIPGHAHPVLATLLAAALTFGGIDLRKVARIRQELERVTNQAGLPPDAIADVAARIAILEVQDPQVARALRALAPPRTRRPTTNPARRPRRSTLDPDDGDEDT